MTNEVNNPTVAPPKDNLKTINTLKRRKLMKALTNASTLMEAGMRAGYRVKEGSRQIYRKSTREHIEKTMIAMGYDEESIKKDFKRLQALAEKRNDLSNANRSLENISRISGLFKDKLEQTIDNKTSPSVTDEQLLQDIEIEAVKLRNKPSVIV